MTDSSPPPRRRGPAPRDRTADPEWRHHLERTRHHLTRHGNLARAGDATRSWADGRIRALRADTLPPAERDALTAAGLTPDTPTTSDLRRRRTLDTFLTELDWWIAKHGHARVPQMARSRKVDGGPYWLGKRVSEYRIAHSKGTLDPAVAAELERRPGWAWRVKEDRWAQMWDDTCTRLEARVASGARIVDLAELDHRLYQWVLRQRRHFDTLPAQQRARLQRIPGALQPRDRRVDLFVTAARQWLRAEPGRTMAHLRYADTITMPDGEHIPLGRRATYYRRRYHDLERATPLTPEEISAIETLDGWSWKLNERYRHRHGRIAKPLDATTGPAPEDTP